MSAFAKLSYVEAQRDASRAAREALVRQFEAAGHEHAQAEEIVSRYVEESAMRFQNENAGLFEGEGVGAPADHVGTRS